MDELKKALAYARDQGVSDRQLAALVKVEADRVRFQPAEGVAMTHPELDDREIRVPESSVEQMRLSGWVPKDERTDIEREADEQAAAARAMTEEK